MTTFSNLIERLSKTFGLTTVPPQAARQPLPADAPPPEADGPPIAGE